MPLHSVEKQQREAEFERAKQHYSRPLAMAAPAPAVAQARRGLVEAGHRVASVPNVYTFVFVAATVSGTIRGVLRGPASTSPIRPR